MHTPLAGTRRWCPPQPTYSSWHLVSRRIAIFMAHRLIMCLQGQDAGDQRALPNRPGGAAAARLEQPHRGAAEVGWDSLQRRHGYPGEWRELLHPLLVQWPRFRWNPAAGPVFPLACLCHHAVHASSCPTDRSAQQPHCGFQVPIWRRPWCGTLCLACMRCCAWSACCAMTGLLCTPVWPANPICGACTLCVGWSPALVSLSIKLPPLPALPAEGYEGGMSGAASFMHVMRAPLG